MSADIRNMPAPEDYQPRFPGQKPITLIEGIQPFTAEVMKELVDNGFTEPQITSIGMIPPEVTKAYTADEYGNMINPRIDPQGGRMENGMNASEAVYGLMAWLTIREESLTLGARHDSALPARLIKQFCETNNLPEITPAWPGNLIHPESPSVPHANEDDEEPEPEEDWETPPTDIDSNGNPH